MCRSLPDINMNQSQVCMCPLPLETPSPLLPPPTPTDCHRAPDLSFLHHTANFHWLPNCTYGNVYVSTLPSQFIPPSPSPAMSTSLFSMSASLLLPCQ